MFDFTRVSRACGFLLLGYVALYPLLAVGYAAASGLLDAEGGEATLLTLLVWPGPLVFLLGSTVLVLDRERRLRAGTLTTSQLTGYRAAGLLQVLGSAFALGSGTWWPVVACLAGWVRLLSAARRPVLPSTWSEPS